MLKKVVGLLMGILLLMVSVSFAEETPASIQSMTELGEIQKKLDQGITIGKVYYTDGYGFSTSEFTTDDPDEIAQLWNAVNAIRVGEKVNESITDWYPQIVFCLTDGTEVVKLWQDRSRRESWTPEMKEKARQKDLERRSHHAKS